MLSLYYYIDLSNLYDLGNFYKVNPKIIHLSVIYTKGHVCKHALFYISTDLMNQLNDGYASIQQILKKCSPLEGFIIIIFM